MKLDTSGLDLERLARVVNEEYALGIDTILFQPKGEASYNYVAVGRDGTRWLVKAQDIERADGLEARLQVVGYLHHERGLAQVLAPLRNRRGDYTYRQGRYILSIFPFVAGATIYEGEATDAHIAAIAPLMARFHRSDASLPVALPVETFDNPFEAPIRRVLRVAEAPDPAANAVQQQVRELVLAQRADILRSLDTMDELRAQLGRLSFDRALTHGDPNQANILVDMTGELHLIDWDDLAFGPLERDLIFFTDWGPGHFELFLRQYLAAYGPARLHTEAFAFYEYRWAVQEIADYTTRILYRNVDPAEDAHAWAELQPYLPTQHAGIADKVRTIMEVVQRVIEEGTADGLTQS